MERDKFINQLGELVAIKTIASKNQNLTIRTPEEIEAFQISFAAKSKALDLVEHWAGMASLKTERELYKNAEILLIGTGKNFRRPEIGFLVHVDVVAAENQNLFTMEDRGGKLIGRGVNDMKYSIPLGLELLRKFSKRGRHVDMTLAITTDEEIGGPHAGRHLAETFRPKLMIVPDGGDNFKLVEQTKGVAHIRVDSSGIPGHASKPWDGRSAITPLVKLINVILDKYDINSNEKNWETTVNIGTFNGGHSPNQICEKAESVIDFRFPSPRTPVEIENEVKMMASKISTDLKVGLVAEGDAVFIDTTQKEIVKFIEIAERKLGRKIEITKEEGASDVRYWSKYNIPTMIIKPDCGGLHSENEWLDIDSAMTYFEIMFEYITEISK